MSHKVATMIHGIVLYPGPGFEAIEPELVNELVELELVESTPNGKGVVQWLGSTVCELRETTLVIPVEEITTQASPETITEAEQKRVDLLDLLRTGTRPGRGAKAVNAMMARQNPAEVAKLRAALETASMRTVMIWSVA
jgi:hypothetical protein